MSPNSIDLKVSPPDVLWDFSLKIKSFPSLLSMLAISYVQKCVFTQIWSNVLLNV